MIFCCYFIDSFPCCNKEEREKKNNKLQEQELAYDLGMKVNGPKVNDDQVN